jgi:hypothetical protein
MTLDVVSDGDQRRPYAAAANVLAVLDRARRVNLPERVNSDWLEILGIPEVSRGRVLEALRFLRFITDDGRPTDLLRSYAGAPDDEVRELLAAAIRDAYADDFGRIDPATDTQPRVIAAFRRYQPRSQTNRMVMLFLGLARSAGIAVQDAPRERGMQAERTGRPTANRQQRQPRNPAVGGTATKTTQRTPNPDTGATVDALMGQLARELTALPDAADFETAWKALGEVARARAKALAAAQPETPNVEAEPDEVAGG